MSSAARVLHCLAMCFLTLECSLQSLGATVKNPEDLVDRLQASNCNVNMTIDEEAVMHLREAVIQQELLLRLNLDKVPDTHLDPETLRKFQEQYREEYQAVRAALYLRDANYEPCVDVDTRISKVSVIFPKMVETKCTQCQQKRSTANLNHTYRLTFDLDISTLGEITKTELRLYKLLVNQSDTSRLHERVDLFFVDPNTGKFHGVESMVAVAGQNVRTDQEGYIILDVKSAIDKFKVQHPSLHGELLLEVHIRTPNKTGYSLPPKVQFVTDNTTTQLVITATVEEPDSEPELEKRSVYKRNADTRTGIECSVRKLNFDFRARNWSWVINPDVLELNYCFGVCSRVNTRTKHSEYISRRNVLTSNPVGSPEPCCVPNGFKSDVLSTIQKGSSSTGVEVLDRITITSCICR